MADKTMQERMNELAEAEKAPKNILSWLIHNAIGFMIAGFAILIVAAVSFTFVVNQPGILRIIALWSGFIGFGIYMIGRVSLSIKRRRQSTKLVEKADTQNEDSE
jgi:nitrate reductase gamma subunit